MFNVQLSTSNAYHSMRTVPINMRGCQPGCLVLGTLIAVCFVAAECASEAESDTDSVYPQKPIQLVVPFGAGGGTDTFARIVKKAIDDHHLLPQPVVIINRGGAGATIGSRSVKNAKPDGYTVLVLHEAILTAKYSGTVDYGPEVFEPVAGTGEVGMVIAVPEESPYTTLTELLGAAKANPDTIIFGANLGAMTHFAGLALEREVPGASFRFVQCGGGATRFAELKGGHIEVTGFSIEEFLRYRSAGLRGLAVLGERPHPAVPDVPTARSQGIDLVTSTMFYWWVPKGTPQRRSDELAQVLKRAMQTDDVRSKMAEIHCEPIFLEGQALRDRLARQAERFSRIKPPPPLHVPNFTLILSAATGLLLALVLINVWNSSSAQNGRAVVGTAADQIPAHGDPQSLPRTGMAVLILGLTVLYVSALASGRLGFRPATVLYVFATGAALTRLRWRSLPVLTALALGLGFGLHYLFTQVFVVDLP